nr:hypothetical protein CFP56_64551 [Quercus suber]
MRFDVFGIWRLKPRLAKSESRVDSRVARVGAGRGSVKYEMSYGLGTSPQSFFETRATLDFALSSFPTYTCCPIQVQRVLHLCSCNGNASNDTVERHDDCSQGTAYAAAKDLCISRHFI